MQTASSRNRMHVGQPKQATACPHTSTSLYHPYLSSAIEQTYVHIHMVLTMTLLGLCGAGQAHLTFVQGYCPGW